MIRLIRFELAKILFYKSFWFIFGTYVLVLAGAIKYAPQGSALYASSFIAQIFLGYLVITLFSNEFEHKTLRQHIMNGLGRAEAMLSKFILFVMLILFSVICIFSLSILIDENIVLSSEWLAQIGLELAQFSLRTLAFLSFAVMVTQFFTRASSAIAIFFVWPLLFEPTLGWVINKYFEAVQQWLPGEVFSRLLKSPMSAMMKMDMEVSHSAYYVTFVYIVLFWGLSYFKFSKSDI